MVADGLLGWSPVTRSRTPGPEIQDGGDYSGAEFRNLKATGARLRNVAFSGCLFDRCSFGGAELSGCSFTDCTFTTCDLSLAKVPTSRFIDVRFLDSKLVGFDWTIVDRPAKLALQVSFERCLVSQSSFFGVNLHGLRLLDSTAREADFAAADLGDAVLTRTDLAGALFSDTNLTGADLRGATGYLIDPLQNRVRKARFSMPDAIGLLTGLGVQIE